MATPPPGRPPSAVASVTEITPETGEACWHLKGFSFMNHNAGVAMDSGELLEAAGIRFRLRAYWGGHPKATEGNFSLFCVPVEGPNFTNYMGSLIDKISITVFGRNGDRLMSREDSQPGEIKIDSGWRDFGQLSQLKRMLVDDSFFVQLSVAAWRRGQEETRQLPAAPVPSSPSSSGALLSTVAVTTENIPETAKACWDIRGFSLVDKRKDVAMDSPELLEAAGHRFSLRAYWGGYQNADGDVSLFCGSVPREGLSGSVMMKASISIYTLQGARIMHQSEMDESFHELPPGALRGWRRYGKRATLESLLVDDSLRIELSVAAFRPGQEQVRQFPVSPGIPSGSAIQGETGKRGGELVEDLAAFLAAGQATDVELTGTHGETSEHSVKAHRFMLASRSTVFNRMLLASGMREAQASAKIPLDGFDTAIVERFVRFLYADELDKESMNDQDALCHLLALGHRYEVRSLKRQCLAHLAVTEDTAIEQLMLSEQLGIDPLKERVMYFICSCRNRLVQVQKTEAFARMFKSYPQLAAELFARATRTMDDRPRALAASPY